MKPILPVVLDGFILFWAYRDFGFTKADDILLHGTNWWWMFLSLVFGVFAQVFRGWRWRQTLGPLGAFPKRSDCANAILISYATSLVVSRIGEVSRCETLAKYNNVPLAKPSGIVVTERLVDTLTILFITGITALLRLPIFVTFPQQTGTGIFFLVHFLAPVWFYITLLCFIGMAILLYYLRKALFFYERVKGFIPNIQRGIMSLKGVHNTLLFILYTLATWAYYFLHFYFTFCCFTLTAYLGTLVALVMFVGGIFAVIMSTPSRAGPWHFAIVSMMVLYGVNVMDAGIFALIVYGIQTFLVVLLGIYGFTALSFTNRYRG